MTHNLDISQAAFDLIVAEEVTSEDFYKKRYSRPEWPGEQSGVTIGIGYDVGQASKAQFLADWSGRIPPATVSALAKTCGVTGPAAKPLAMKLRSIVDVPWDVALEVFRSHDVPRYTAILLRALPNAANLPPDCRGALLSLVFNRGASFGKPEPRYAEMRGIKAALAAGDLHRIPHLLREMKRLWPATSGLRGRRDREAALFEQGLVTDKPQTLLVPAVPSVDPDLVATVQKRLRDLGYFDVGMIDGTIDPKGRAESAILAFRNEHDLPLTPAIDDELIASLAKASPRPVSEARAGATTEDLREQHSETIGFTDKVKGWAGKLVGGGGGLTAAGLLTVVTDQAGKISAAKDAVGGLGLSPQLIMVLIALLIALAMVTGAGFLIWHVVNTIEQKRLADYRIGKNT